MTDRLVKIGLSVVLGFFDAMVSHNIEPRIPVFLIMLYSVPIEYTIITPVYMAVKKVARKVMQS